MAKLKKVKGYKRKDGTHVPGYKRHRPAKQVGGSIPTGKVRAPIGQVKTLI